MTSNEHIGHSIMSKIDKGIFSAPIFNLASRNGNFTGEEMFLTCKCTFFGNNLILIIISSMHELTDTDNCILQKNTCHRI